METPTTRVWLRMFREGELNEAQSAFWREKPSEELYDLENDPDLVNNLAASAGHAAERERLAAALRRQLLTIRDLSFLPEGEMHRRAADRGGVPWTYGQGGYQIERVLPAAELATDRSRWGSGDIDRLIHMLADPDSAVRAWAAIGLRTRGEEAVLAARLELRAALDDPSPPVRILAAEALGRFGEDADLAPAVDVLLAAASIAGSDFFDALLALNALDYLPPEVFRGPDAQDWRNRLTGLPTELEGLDRRFRNYVPRLLEAIWLDLPDP